MNSDQCEVAVTVLSRLKHLVASFFGACLKLIVCISGDMFKNARLKSDAIRWK